MKAKIQRICMILGTVLMLSALAAVSWEQFEAMRARRSVQDLMPKILEQIVQRQNGETEEIPDGVLWVPDSYDGEYDAPMPVVEIDGNACVGYLTLLGLDMRLPVLSQWSSANEKIAPCRCAGSVGTRDLAIAAQNYPAHFGVLEELQAGDLITFTDMDGIVTTYEVATVDHVTPTEMQQLLEEPFDLALLTRFGTGNGWIAVYCDLAK